jgi:hypothetical protein
MLGATALVPRITTKSVCLNLTLGHSNIVTTACHLDPVESLKVVETLKLDVADAAATARRTSASPHRSAAACPGNGRHDRDGID